MRQGTGQSVDILKKRGEETDPPLGPPEGNTAPQIS